MCLARQYIVRVHTQFTPVKYLFIEMYCTVASVSVLVSSERTTVNSTCTHTRPQKSQSISSVFFVFLLFFVTDRCWRRSCRWVRHRRLHLWRRHCVRGVCHDSPRHISHIGHSKDIFPTKWQSNYGHNIVMGMALAEQQRRRR